MKKLGTYLGLLILSICCMTGVSFAGDTAQPLEPAPGYVLTKYSFYQYGSSGSDADKDLISLTDFSYKFDENGNITYKKQQTNDSNGNVYSFESTYSYDTTGNMLSSMTTGDDGLHEKAEYTYDENHNLIKIVEDDETTCIKTYDEKGNLIREETTIDNAQVDVILYTYNADGLLETQEETTYYGSQPYLYTTRYTYNSEKRIQQKESTTTVDNKVVRKALESYSYDKNGNVLTEKTSEYYNGKHESETLAEYSYNQNGLCIQISYKRWNSSYSETVTLEDAETITYEYDNNQNNTCVTTSYNGKKQKCIICEYEKIPKNDTTSSPFVDVQDPNSYCYDAVLWAVENGVTNGYDETHFLPNRSCTRAQIVTFLWRAAGSPEPSSNNNPFTDVKDGPYYKAILWAVEKGITKGTTATTFAPNAACTRAQIVTFIYRAAGEPQIQNSTNPFTDVKGGAYYKAILWAVDSGITKGTTATTFAPSATCTRGQGVTFLYRGRDLLQ